MNLLKIKKKSLSQVYFRAGNKTLGCFSYPILNGLSLCFCVTGSLLIKNVFGANSAGDESIPLPNKKLFHFSKLTTH